MQQHNAHNECNKCYKFPRQLPVCFVLYSWLGSRWFGRGSSSSNTSTRLRRRRCFTGWFLARVTSILLCLLFLVYQLLLCYDLCLLFACDKSIIPATISNNSIFTYPLPWDFRGKAIQRKTWGIRSSRQHKKGSKDQTATIIGCQKKKFAEGMPQF